MTAGRRRYTDHAPADRRWSEGRCAVAGGRSIALHIFSRAENQMEQEQPYTRKI